MEVSDTAGFSKSWMSWWIECQPSARAKEVWPFPRQPQPAIQWGKLLNGGRNGIFLFLMALAWWARSLDSGITSSELAKAVSDLSWVLCQLASELVAPPLPSTPPTPSPEVEVTSRTKRKITLTEKALSSADHVKKRFCWG